MTEKEIFNIVCGITGAFFTYIFGTWDTALIVLLTLIALDYITGIWSAYIRKKISSDIGRKGILKKATILIVLIVAVLLDRLINENTCVFRTLVCWFYIGNEGISILENSAAIGIPIPVKVKDALEQLRSKEG